jgi:hypothetical protein
MAQQKGIIPIKGGLGGLSFYFDKRTGWQVRTKGGFHGKDIKSAPEFVRTRENGAEFARASQSAKMLRLALHPLLAHITDNTRVNRLNTRMLDVVKSDPVSERGRRSVINGTCDLLKGFEFNVQSPFSSTVETPVSISRDLKASSVSIAFDTITNLRHPQGATHFCIDSRVVAVNFTTLKSQSCKSEIPAELISLSAMPATPATRIHSFGRSNATHGIVGLSIAFFQQVNDDMLPLHDSKYQSGVIAEIYSLV